MNAEQLETLNGGEFKLSKACLGEGEVLAEECENACFEGGAECGDGEGGGYFGFKKALREINGELKKQASDLCDVAEELNEVRSDDSLQKSGKKRDGFCADSEGAPTAEQADVRDRAKESNEKSDEKSVENERYRSEFNEFRYARCLSCVIADMRGVYGSGKITAALCDFESEKPYAYAFTTRGLVYAGAYVKNARKALKKSRSVQKKPLLLTEADNKVKKSCAIPRLCAIIGGEKTDSVFSVTLKEIRSARKLGADEIEVSISPSVAVSGNRKAIRAEIKALKRACFNRVFKLGVRLNELNDLQAEALISIGAALKIKAFCLYGDGAFFKLQRLKSLAPDCRFELYSPESTDGGLNELISGGADKICTPHLTELSRSVRAALKNAKV